MKIVQEYIRIRTALLDQPKKISVVVMEEEIIVCCLLNEMSNYMTGKGVGRVYSVTCE